LGKVIGMRGGKGSKKQANRILPEKKSTVATCLPQQGDKLKVT